MEPDQGRAVDYSRLPEPVRLEDTVTTSETRRFDDGQAEWDRETQFLLRTCGAF